jgi:hypothetical protein
MRTDSQMRHHLQREIVLTLLSGRFLVYFRSLRLLSSRGGYLPVELVAFRTSAQAGLTLAAWGPFCPWVTSNSTVSPSFSDLKPLD